MSRRFGRNQRRKLLMKVAELEQRRLEAETSIDRLSRDLYRSRLAEQNSFSRALTYFMARHDAVKYTLEEMAHHMGMEMAYHMGRAVGESLEPYIKEAAQHRINSTRFSAALLGEAQEEGVTITMEVPRLVIRRVIT